MATTESSRQKHIAEDDQDSCTNGYKRCDGPDSEELPCFECYCENFENENDEETCLDCGTVLEYGALIDTVTGQRGWACNECNVVYSSLQM